MNRNERPTCPGISGRFPSEQVADFARNGWPTSPEYAADYRLTNFLIFLPSPKRLLPITAADHGLLGADADGLGHLPGRHSPCMVVERHGLRRPLPRVCRRLDLFNRPPQ
jgi:hypothetical protein